MVLTQLGYSACSQLYWFLGNMCLTNTSKKTSCLRRSKLTFCYFLNDSSFITILVQKCLKLDIAFLRYGNFIEDVIYPDCWKVDFEIKALENLWICTKYWYFGNSKVNFYLKTGGISTCCWWFLLFLAADDILMWSSLLIPPFHSDFIKHLNKI